MNANKSSNASTPTPWRVGDRDIISFDGAYSHVGPLVILGGEGECLVATIETENDETGGVQSEADARLIVEAVNGREELLARNAELLAALEAQVAAFEAVDKRTPAVPGNYNAPAWWDAWFDAAMRARVAIARARGEGGAA